MAKRPAEKLAQGIKIKLGQLGYLGVVIQIALGLVDVVLAIAFEHPVVRMITALAACVCLGLAIPTWRNVRRCRKMERDFQAKHGVSLRALAGL